MPALIGSTVPGTAYSVLELVAVPRREVERLSTALFEAGALGLEEAWLPGEAPEPRQPWDKGPAPPEPDHVILRAWFEDPDREAIERDLAHLLAVLPGAPLWGEVEDRDWDAEWRAAFPPFEVAGLVVAPPWDIPPGEDVLIIEPGQGFGTGHHESTRAALRHLLALVRQGPVHKPPLSTALDVGCGSGILALAAAKLGLKVEGIDVEPAAVRDAQRNAHHNSLDAVFSTTPLAQIDVAFDLVLANLHAELLLELADELERVTGGYLVMAGILADRLPAVLARFDPVHFDLKLRLLEQAIDGEWVSLVFQRRA